MARFVHQYADKAEFRHSLKTSGVDGDTLVITANIPLRVDSSGYDQSKVNDLTEAAVAFAKDAGVRIEFLSVS